MGLLRFAAGQRRCLCPAFAHPRPHSSFPKRTHFIGFRFGLLCSGERSRPPACQAACNACADSEANCNAGTCGEPLQGRSDRTVLHGRRPLGGEERSNCRHLGNDVLSREPLYPRTDRHLPVPGYGEIKAIWKKRTHDVGSLFLWKRADSWCGKAAEHSS